MAVWNKVGRPMLVRGNIWYIFRQDGRKFTRLEWVIYNIEQNQYSTIVDLIPNKFGFNMYSCVADGDYIYSINPHDVAVFDTQNEAYMIKITADRFKNATPYNIKKSYPCLVSNGLIFMKSQIYNIKTQKYKPLKPSTLSSIRLYNNAEWMQDQKTNEIFALDKGYHHYILVQLRSLKENDNEYQYTINTFYKIFFNFDRLAFCLLYDGYFICNQEGHCDDIYVQDIKQNQPGCRVVADPYLKMKPGRRNAIIVNHYDDMNKGIVSQFAANINNKLHVPDDVLSLIALFFGDHHNKKIHIFDSRALEGDLFIGIKH